MNNEAQICIKLLHAEWQDGRHIAEEKNATNPPPSQREQRREQLDEWTFMMRKERDKTIIRYQQHYVINEIHTATGNIRQLNEHTKALITYREDLEYYREKLHDVLNTLDTSLDELQQTQPSTPYSDMFDIYMNTQHNEEALNIPEMSEHIDRYTDIDGQTYNYPMPMCDATTLQEHEHNIP